MSVITRCRSCGADIIWATTERGKRHPLDAGPTPAGEWLLTQDLRMVRATATADVPKHTSHFATCPEGRQWSRKGSS